MSTEFNVMVKGRVPGGLKSEVVKIIKDCYKHFGAKVPQKVEIIIVDRAAVMHDFLKDEEFKLGIKATEAEDFLCCFDGRKEIPRIIICAEKLHKLSTNARAGVIRHEAAHSALHSNLEYYIFQISESCQKKAMIRSIDNITVAHALHLISEAVKDYEATRFLVRNGYVKDQFAMVLETLRPSEAVKEDWRTAQSKRVLRYYHESGLFGPLFITHPIQEVTDSKKIPLQKQVDLGRRVEMLIEHLPETEQRKLTDLVGGIIASFSEDTHKNVDIALERSLDLA